MATKGIECMFQLDPRLDADTVFINALPLCDLRLMLDANYPWLVLIPRVAGITELYELADKDYSQFALESRVLSALISTHFVADKMNIAALGNVVSQLHIHHIVRYEKDAAWPNPIWGAVAQKSYSPDELEMTLNSLKALIVTNQTAFKGGYE